MTANELSDRYSLSLVKFELSMRSRGRKAIHSFSQKGLHRLGDGVAVALLKLVDPEDLRTSQTALDILPIIRDAFSSPKFIEEETNRDPKVTLFLLEHLWTDIRDERTQSEIQQTIGFVKEKTDR